jgi:hypothetical protein
MADQYAGLNIISSTNEWQDRKKEFSVYIHLIIETFIYHQIKTINKPKTRGVTELMRSVGRGRVKAVTETA